MPARWLDRSFVSAMLAAALASCGQPGSAPAVTAPPAETQQQPPTSVTQAVASALPQTLPAPGQPPRFVGMWAVDQRLCAQPAWRFEADEVSTQGEVHCDFNRVLPVPTGYSVQASCTAEGPPAPYEIEFSFAESARAMMISGGPWAHATLVYCGPLTTN